MTTQRLTLLSLLAVLACPEPAHRMVDQDVASAFYQPPQPRQLVYDQPPVPDTVSQTARARSLLDELLLRFPDNHPAVIEARRILGELQKRRTEELEKPRGGGRKKQDEGRHHALADQLIQVKRSKLVD